MIHHCRRSQCLDVALTARTPRSRVAWVVAAASVAAAALVAVWAVKRPAHDPYLVLSLESPRHAGLAFYNQVALSPDGTRVVFVGHAGPRRSLWLRGIDEAEGHELPGTEGAKQPFWSPDGVNIGFFADGKLKRIAAAGGPPLALCSAPDPYGGTWSAKGTILFGPDSSGPLARVDANGGAPVTVTHLAPREEAHRWPWFLPDGEHFVFHGDASHAEDHHLKVGSLKGDSRDLMQGISDIEYVKNGYILFVRGGSLLAQRFDVKTLAVSGDAHVLATDLAQNSSNHRFEFSASDTGRLTYRSSSPALRFAWVDSQGKRLQYVTEPRRSGYFVLAPDDRSVAFETMDADGRGDDLWLLDFARGIVTRLTVDPATDLAPVWSPDGQSIAFTSMRKGEGDLFVVQKDNVSSAHEVFSAPLGAFPSSWSPQGFTAMDYAAGSVLDIWVYSEKSGKAEPYLSTPFNEFSASFSPDGSKIAYVSNESGQNEVYVEEFPSHAHRRQVSTNGGTYATWARSGNELYYLTPDRTLVSVDLRSETSAQTEMFALPGGFYSVAADGRRVLVDEPVERIEKRPVTFVTNWMAAIPAE